MSFHQTRLTGLAFIVVMSVVSGPHSFHRFETCRPRAKEATMGYRMITDHLGQLFHTRAHTNVSVSDAASTSVISDGEGLVAQDDSITNMSSVNDR